MVEWWKNGRAVGGMMEIRWLSTMQRLERSRKERCWFFLSNRTLSRVRHKTGKSVAGFSSAIERSREFVTKQERALLVFPQQSKVRHKAEMVQV
jgi:hypothetical protein